MAAAGDETSREKMRRRGLPIFAALALWLAWTVVAVFLIDRWPVSGIHISVVLLAALTCFGLAILTLFLRREFWRQRRQDLARLERYNDEMQRLIWLSSRISPRRPLPLRDGMEARPAILNAAWELIRSERPKRVLELGSGLSTLLMAYALEANGEGQLEALENHAQSAAKTRRLLAEHRMQAQAQVLDAPLTPFELDGDSYRWYTLPDLGADKPVDLLFVDGPAGRLAPMVRYPALPLLRRRLADDAVILLDDTFRAHESQILARWLKTFPDLVLDDRYDSKEFAVLRLGRANARR